MIQHAPVKRPMAMAMAIFVGWALLLLSCGAKAPAAQLDTGAIAALDRNTSPRVVPQARAAAVYESKPAEARVFAPLDDPVRARLLTALQKAGAERQVKVMPDERLDAAMADLARNLDPEEQPKSEAVEFLLGYHGIIEPYPLLYVVSVPQESYEEAISELLETAELPASGTLATVGIGLDRTISRHTIVVAIQSKYLDMAPISRQQPSGARLTIEGRLLGTFSRPALYVTNPSGHPTQRPLRTDGVAFRAVVTCADGDGRYQIEIFGSDKGGPKVLANFAVSCGVEPSAELLGTAGYRTEYVVPKRAEARLLELINQARANAGLAPLTADPGLAEVARGHSRDMFDNDFFAHVSPTTGRPIDRAYRAGLRVERLLENIGTAGSPAEVHRDLMRSPGHRAAILDPKVTRVGVGVVVPAPGTPFRIIATELFR